MKTLVTMAAVGLVLVGFAIALVTFFKVECVWNAGDDLLRAAVRN